ncbi:MAG: COX15/CtaA family protein [Gammaproteobacteria bacterium]|nr:COX15/CtaA family protein [Gammaproteobacteria bacterium]MBU1416633.1 COX15/CtaA family protein [Gammaproteobacteria bacterium]
MSRARAIALLALYVALVVVPLGAYVRLSDAGLGCPDWPGCYGKLVGVPDHPEEHAAAAQAFPDKPVEAGKAWKEMIHRYVAGTLGLLVFAAGLLAWRRRPVVSAVLAVTIVFQALLGMWTVTLLLKPAIVTAHLLGGMTVVALLTLQAMMERDATNVRTVPSGASTLAWLALVALAVQIGLGGWVSSNYAGLACQDFPTCQGAWLPAMDFGHGFTLRRELGYTGQGVLLPFEALTAIHWSHRLGALLVFLTVGALIVRLRSAPAWQPWAFVLAVLLLLQVGLGVANVLLSLPLPLAVAHNFGAALLLLHVVAVNMRLSGR